MIPYFNTADLARVDNEMRDPAMIEVNAAQSEALEELLSEGRASEIIAKVLEMSPLEPSPALTYLAVRLFVLGVTYGVKLAGAGYRIDRIDVDPDDDDGDDDVTQIPQIPFVQWPFNNEAVNLGG